MTSEILKIASIVVTCDTRDTYGCSSINSREDQKIQKEPSRKKLDRKSVFLKKQNTTYTQ